ncbi:MAG TPA: hypothetical protein VGQ46_16280 [Thermoanaerobaculia bacterium]|nr:hypothetical protein [Thermoanaerobaculia bacterium]
MVELSEKSFDRYMDLKDFLQELLGRKVDLVLKSAIKTRCASAFSGRRFVRRDAAVFLRATRGGDWLV